MNFETTYDVMTDSGGKRMGPDLSVVVRVTSSICSLLVVAVLVALAVIYFPGLTDWRPSWEFSGWHAVAGFLFIVVWKLTTMSKWLEDYAVWKTRAREWISQRDFTITEGIVSNTSCSEPDGKSIRPATYSIEIGEQKFTEQYWQEGLRTGFEVGDYVRITHHEGAVLKVEVADELPQSVRES